MGVLVLHVPPGVGSVSVVVLPTHMLLPTMAPGEGLTVIVFVLKQPNPSVNVTVLVPAETPVTMPSVEPISSEVDIRSLDQKPAPEVSVRVTVVPIHTVDGPNGTEGAGVIVTVEMALQPASKV